ncbi:hypothetical protein ASPACDRAFT_44246 [Aspergillus aculeatus ATCC 16872]|uniref:F-box domain-containing protein n=1 Tax=Aspergillus aculeatus (strain ATCC 16872 / CBS 172.66 / WB 5094) TaxID=690307 RepID=A0A1L9WR12_ASPA1|nr:uncharacterized protein ASPACDRAFT_44246 [Aspergillus aculeatus ATCC 16872]OJJ98615.1 hypothetical protein ASPACDRAFT_44246 [Aspergillus aculeatus ATCC 16872]
MAATLPLELLIQIATFLKSTGAPLTPCVTVCRRWQAAFEPLVYREVHVYTTDDLEEVSPGRALFLANLDRITSSAGISRRAWIRQLRCHLVIPYELPDWQAIQLEDYSTDNEVRRANDHAFQSGIIALFTTLSDWDPGLRLTVQLTILGQEEMLEPHTDHDTFTGQDTWDLQDGETLAVPLYRASFGDSDPSMLPVVPCINRLWFIEDCGEPAFHLAPDIWEGAAMQIARKCSTMSTLCLSMEERIKPDHLNYIQAGKWVTLPLPERQAKLDAIEDWTAFIRDEDEGDEDRELLDTEHFQRVLISLGHAARRMPKLTALNFPIEGNPDFDLLVEFTPYERAQLLLYSELRPDNELLRLGVVHSRASLRLWEVGGA